MKRRIFLQGGSAAFATLLAGCGGGGGGAGDALVTGVTGGNVAAPSTGPLTTTPSDAAPAARGPLSAQETGQVPILTDGQLVTPESHWNDPSVVYEDGGYTMWASCAVSWATMEIRIYRLRSSDRVNWSLSPAGPVLVHGAPGSWDAKSVETPSVVKFNGSYHMFYTGYAGHFGASKEYRIGHAISSDGVHWTKDASFFLGPTDPDNASPTFDFRQWVCAEPGAVVVGNKLHVYFTAIGAVQQLGSDVQSIGVTIHDPATGQWSTPQLALLPDQSLYPRSQFYGFSTPAAGIVDGQVALFYSIVTATPWKQVAVGNAVSADGLTGWRYNSWPVVSRDEPWRSNECRAPAILQDSAGTHLFFAGDDGARLGIAYRQLA